jgi:hypothetical protein
MHPSLALAGAVKVLNRTRMAFAALFVGWESLSSAAGGELGGRIHSEHQAVAVATVAAVAFERFYEAGREAPTLKRPNPAASVKTLPNHARADHDRT